jgi:glycosyltransferase involved in cell wall biosynthesis
MDNNTRFLTKSEQRDLPNALNKPKFSLIMPCYNEIRTIDQIVHRVLNTDFSLEKELIIIDDCSVDGTRNYLSKLSHPELKVIHHEKNKGKGAAIRTGLNEANGDIVIIQDADLEYDPSELPKLVQPIIDGRADVVYGSRFVGGESHRVLYFWHYVGNRLLTLLSNIFTNLNLTDMEVCYKAFKREIIEKINLTEDRFGFEPEFTAKIARLGVSIYEVGISYNGRTYDEGKKINWKDGFRAIYVILKYGLIESLTRNRGSSILKSSKNLS